MILSANQSLELTTSSTSAIDYVVFYTDYSTDGTTVAPAVSSGQITTATTTTILAAPTTTQREVLHISVRNVGSAANTVVAKLDISATERQLYEMIMAVDDSLVWQKATGWVAAGADGVREMSIVNSGTLLLNTIVTGKRPPEEILKLGSTMEATGIYHSMFYTSGRPGAATAPSPGIAGAALTTYAGQIPFTNPASGNTYLTGGAFSASQIGAVKVLDRLWHNSGIVVTTTTAQTVNSAAWPARDINASTNGEGIMVAIEVSTATTNASPIANTTLSYTNQSGTAGRTATMSSFPATAVAGTWVPFQLQAGDTGIRSIQSITLGTSYGAGAIHLVAYRELQTIPLIVANTGNTFNSLTGNNTRLFNDTVPFFIWLASSATGVTVTGELVYSQPG